jgi:hypothetical protein
LVVERPPLDEINAAKPRQNIARRAGHPQLINRALVRDHARMRRHFEIWDHVAQLTCSRVEFQSELYPLMIVEVLWFCGQIIFFGIIFGRSTKSATGRSGKSSCSWARIK